MVMTCFTSDFIHSAADEWRPEAWQMMKTFSDLQFYSLRNARNGSTKDFRRTGEIVMITYISDSHVRTNMKQISSPCLL
jgi:hypothetical protein